MSKPNLIEIRIEGKTLRVPCTHFGELTIIATGRWLRIAAVQDEDYADPDPAGDAPTLIAGLKSDSLRADIFTFVQRLPATEPKYTYGLEWDNVAAIPTHSYQEWWSTRVSKGLRSDVKRASKRGVDVRLVEFTDQLVQGILEIYNETTVRQGRVFSHFGKSFDQVKTETGTYLERSEFIGAFLNDELIGYMKLTFVGQLARVMQFSTKTAHQDKRPSNALIAKAVEVCELRGCSHLIYDRYTYLADNSLTAFKHRNGFEKVLIPRYYVPLTLRGRIALRLRMHHGLRAMVPTRAVLLLRRLRATVLRWTSAASAPASPSSSLPEGEGGQPTIARSASSDPKDSS